MTKLVLVVLVVLVVSGCAQQVIYISTLHGTSEQVNRVKQLFESNKYDVELVNTQLSAPNEDVIIIHSPILRNEDYINSVISTLKGAGFNKFNIITDSSFNHFYNELNVGIYLPTQSFLMRPAVPAVMQTSECQSKYGTLESMPNMTLTIDIEVDKVSEHYIHIGGAYELHENGEGYVAASKGKIYFTLKSAEVETYLGMRPAHILTIQRQEFEMLPMPCSFITIYEH